MSSAGPARPRRRDADGAARRAAGRFGGWMRRTLGSARAGAGAGAGAGGGGGGGADAPWVAEMAAQGHAAARALVTVEAVLRRPPEEGPMPSSDVILMEEQDLELDVDVDADASPGGATGALSEFVSNPVLPILSAVEEEVRSMRVGDRRTLSTSSPDGGAGGGSIARLLREVPEWTRELLFRVPESHEEILRLQGRYRQTGGLAAGEVVELANGSNALVVGIDAGVVTLDCNHPLSIVRDSRGNGNELLLNIKLVSVGAAPDDDGGGGGGEAREG